jgi:uncharacterized protein
MPTLNQPVGLGIAVAGYSGGKIALFDTTQPRWWVVNEEDLPSASQNADEVLAFAKRLRSFGGQLSPDPQESEPRQFYIIYKLTDRCNFSCTYCYDRNFTRKLDKSRRDETVRAYLAQLNRHQPGALVSVLFHGGEPFLEFAEIESLLDFGSHLANLRLAYSVQTNASLLNQARFDVLHAHGVGLCFSVDGVEATTNRLRINRYDPNCYDLIKTKIAEIVGLEHDRVGLLFTIGAHNVANVFNSIVQVQSDGFRSVSFSFMHEIDQHTVSAKPEQISGLYARLAEGVLDGRFTSIAIWPLIDWLMKLTFARSLSMCNASPCGAGRQLVTILPSGEVSPCDSLFSDKFLFDDLDAYERARGQSEAFRTLLARRTDGLVDCAECDVRQFCNGTCPGNAALAKGRIDAVNDNECAVHYSIIRDLVWLLADSVTGPKLLAYARQHIVQRQDGLQATGQKH